MKILIIGGTQFVGRALAEAALAAGHDLTLFHRGKTNPGLFPDARYIIGDRDGDMHLLAGQSFDWVIDTCGYVPRVVRQSLDTLLDSVSRYLFVSTIYVYTDLGTIGINEDAQLADTDGVEGEEITRDSYGPHKVLCEHAVTTAYGDRALIIRPGFIIGPHDPTDRLTYWTRRIGSESRVLCPSTGDQPMQCIDVRDLGNWVIDLVGENASGVFHATGPQEKMLFTELLERVRGALGSKSELCWTDPDALKREGVEPFKDMPFWITPKIATHQLDAISIDRALTAGLKLRPLESTIRDLFEWDRSRGIPKLKTGLARDREEALLARLDSPK